MTLMNQTFNFCPQCGSEQLDLTIPDGDNRARQVCLKCGQIHYVNPKVIVGAVVMWQDQFLLCKRDIEPRRGFWTFPAGFLENGETLEEGACRETKEESDADVCISHLVGVYTLVSMNQIHVTYLANMERKAFSPTAESSEVKLFHKKDIPWDELAFPVIKWALESVVDKGRETCLCIDQRSTTFSLSESLKHEF
jgi:ADP-ribose pyrophosphatase YjhB (NUDIX family)